LNTESDLDTNVVRTLMQPEGCGPSVFLTAAVVLLFLIHALAGGLLSRPEVKVTTART